MFRWFIFFVLVMVGCATDEEIGRSVQEGRFVVPQPTENLFSVSTDTISPVLSGASGTLCPADEVRVETIERPNGSRPMPGDRLHINLPNARIPGAVPWVRNDRWYLDGIRPNNPWNWMDGVSASVRTMVPTLLSVSVGATRVFSVSRPQIQGGFGGAQDVSLRIQRQDDRAWLLRIDMDVHGPEYRTNSTGNWLDVVYYSSNPSWRQMVVMVCGVPPVGSDAYLWSSYAASMARAREQNYLRIVYDGSCYRCEPYQALYPLRPAPHP